MVDFGKDLSHILVLAVILSCSIIILIFRRITHHNNHVVKVRHNMHFMPNTLCTNNLEENNNQSYHLKLFRANFLSLRYTSIYTVGISICWKEIVCNHIKCSVLVGYEMFSNIIKLNFSQYQDQCSILLR